MSKATKIILILAIIVVVGGTVFAVLYKDNGGQNTNANTNVNTNITVNTNQPLDTSTWKTYRNEEYGFEVKYPREWNQISNSNAGNQINVNSKYLTELCGCEIEIVLENNTQRMSIEKWLTSVSRKRLQYINQEEFNILKDPKFNPNYQLAGEYVQEYTNIGGKESLKQSYATEGGGYLRFIIPLTDKFMVINAQSDLYYFNYIDKRLAVDNGALFQNFVQFLNQITID